jgi:hypothetical protein
VSPYDVVLSALTADAAVTALVPSGRIQRHYVRDDVLRPAISYLRTATEYVNVIHGEPPAERVTFTITCIADSEDEVEQLGNAVVGIDVWEPLNREDLADPETQEFGTVITVLVTVNIET